MRLHRHQHVISHPKPSSTLHIVAVCSNPVRFRSRYELFRQFQQHVSGIPGVNLICVEAAFGARDFAVTDADNPNHVQVRGSTELWLKENLVNLGFQRLPEDWQYAAWVDGDIMFLNPNWVHDTLNALQHHRVVQMWRDAIDMGPSGGVIQTHRSFGYQYVNGEPMGILQGKANYYGTSPGRKIFPHPGFAWAIRRDAHDGVGQLVDYAILGAGDHHMAWAFVGDVMASVPVALQPSYARRLKAFEKRCDAHVQRDLGYVTGTISHAWHGRKRDRRYVERWDVLVKNKYDPDHDVKYNHQGVIELAGHNHGLRDGIRTYLRARNEDSTDVE